MSAEQTSFRDILSVLCGAEVRFVLVGGLAAVAHGSARATLYVDVVYDRAEDNIGRLVAALRPFRPYPRGAPPDLPFSWDERTVTDGLNFTLTTALGDVDLLGEIVGGGTYAELVGDSELIEVFGLQCRCVTLQRLIQLKRAAGRPRDYEVIAELQLLLEYRHRHLQE